MTAHAELGRIWAEITPDDWLGLASELSPGGSWELKGTRLHGCCPVHDDNDPSSWIDTERRFFKCYACNAYTSDPVQLFAYFAKITYVEAFLAIKQRFGITGLGGKATQAMQERDRAVRIKKALADAFQRELINASQSSNNPDYDRARRTVKWLTARGVDDCYHLLPIGIIPTTKRLREYINDPDLVDDCVNYFRAWLKVEFLGSLVFIYHDTPSSVGRFRIRIPDTKKIYSVEDPYDAGGYFGLGLTLYLPLVQSDAREVLVVEGEFDQLAFAVNQCKTGQAEVPVLALGGSELSNLDGLQAYGFDTVRLLADAPEYSGDTIVKGVLKKTAGPQVKVFAWPATIKAKDPDEAINVKYDYKAASAVFFDKSNYKPAHLWAFSKAIKELEEIDTDDARLRDATIQDWGTILKDEGERAAYLTAMAKDQNLSYSQIAKKVIAADDDELGFVSRLEDAIKDVYTVLGEESTGASSWLNIWNKKKKLLRRLPLARLAEVEVELGKDVGIMSTWIATTIGEPDFIRVRAVGPGGKEKPISLLEKENLIRSYVQLAFKNILSQAGNYRHLHLKGQGVHFVNGNGVPQLLVVNGRNGYVATYKDTGVTWDELDGPSCGKYIVDLDERFQWSDSIQGLDDLKRSAKVDALAVFNKLVDMLSTGWAFSSQDLEPAFLAAQTLAIPVSSALRRQTYIFVTAEASSGKSRLTLGFFGGTQFPSINVLEHSVGFDDYTEAGFRQDMNNKSLMCCLDEFEDDGTKSSKSMEVRKILKVLRNIMGASNRILKGTPGGETKVFYLRFPVIMSAISTMREPADISRMITINMKTDRSRVDPVLSIGEKYTDDDVAQIRSDVTVAMMSRLTELLDNYSSIEQEYAYGEGLPKGTQTRFREGLYPALAVMKTLGLDYQKFAYEFCLTKGHLIAQIASASENDDILSAVLNSPGVSARIEGRVSNLASVSELLQHPDSRNLLNTTGCGVYYTDRGDGEHWLMVNWTQAIQGVLSQHPKYRAERSAGHLKEMADRSEFIVSRDKVRRSGIIRKLAGYAAKIDDITVYDITRIMDPVEEASDEPVAFLDDEAPDFDA